MAGSIGLSLTQRLDNASLEPLDGGTIQFYAAGTTTPQNAYQDVSLTIPWPNPLTLDNGNIPQLFFDDGYIKFRINNSAGVTQLAADNVLVIGPSAGAGAAPSVDASTVMQTGFIAPYYGTGVRTGFVRLNGRTIGSATSGASESANADCEDLFLYLWATDEDLTVSTGRGASAAADWAANKTIALPDWRGYALGALDDMGNSAAGRLTSTYFGTSAIVLGAAGGTESATLTAAQLPANIPNTVTDTIAVALTGDDAPIIGTNGGVNVAAGGFLVPSGANQLGVSKTGTVSVEINATGGSPHATVGPMKLATFYMKK